VTMLSLMPIVLPLRGPNVCACGTTASFFQVTPRLMMALVLFKEPNALAWNCLFTEKLLLASRQQTRAGIITLRLYVDTMRSGMRPHLSQRAKPWPLRKHTGSHAPGLPLPLRSTITTVADFRIQCQLNTLAGTWTDEVSGHYRLACSGNETNEPPDGCCEIDLDSGY
jgi:hypothetical protein